MPRCQRVQNFILNVFITFPQLALNRSKTNLECPKAFAFNKFLK